MLYGRIYASLVEGGFGVMIKLLLCYILTWTKISHSTLLLSILFYFEMISFVFQTGPYHIRIHPVSHDYQHFFPVLSTMIWQNADLNDNQHGFTMDYSDISLLSIHFFLNIYLYYPFIYIFNFTLLLSFLFLFHSFFLRTLRDPTTPQHVGNDVSLQAFLVSRLLGAWPGASGVVEPRLEGNCSWLLLWLYERTSRHAITSVCIREYHFLPRASRTLMLLLQHPNRLMSRETKDQPVEYVFCHPNDNIFSSSSL